MRTRPSRSATRLSAPCSAPPATCRTHSSAKGTRPRAPVACIPVPVWEAACLLLLLQLDCCSLAPKDCGHCTRDVGMRDEGSPGRKNRTTTSASRSRRPPPEPLHKAATAEVSQEKYSVSSAVSRTRPCCRITTRTNGLQLRSETSERANCDPGMKRSLPRPLLSGGR